MCEEQKVDNVHSFRTLLTSLAGSGVSGAAKAAPGAAVGAGAAEVFGSGSWLEQAVTEVTLAYLAIMIFYSMPKCVETIRYFIALWKSKKASSANIVVAEVKDHDLTEKIQQLEIERLRAEIERLKRNNGNGT